MSRFICHNCALENGLINPVGPSTLALNPWDGSTGFPSEYQQRNIQKHATSTNPYPVNGVFYNLSPSTYFGYVSTALHLADLEIDVRNRKNLIYNVGSTTGHEFQNGVLIRPVEGIKLAYPESSTHVHAFPFFLPPEPRTCEICRRAL